MNDHQPKILCRVISSIEELLGFEVEWNDLVDRCTYPSPFRRWECLYSWWNWYGKGRALYTLMVFIDNKLVGILPLYLEPPSIANFNQSRWVRLLGIGGNTHLEYLGLIAEPTHLIRVIETLVKHFQSREFPWSSVEFADIVDDDKATNLLVGCLSSQFSSVSSNNVVSPYMKLPSSYDQLMQTVDGRTRRKKKYQVRRAISELEAELIVVKSPGEIADKLPELVRISIQSNGRLGRKSPFQNEDYFGFHREMMARHGSASIRFLKSSHGLIAFIYGYQYQSKFYSFQVGFDPEWAIYSPGDVLHHLTYEALISEGATEFDYLRGDEPYKFQFGQQQRTLHSTLVYKRWSEATLAKSKNSLIRVLRRLGKRAF